MSDGITSAVWARDYIRLQLSLFAVLCVCLFVYWLYVLAAASLCAFGSTWMPNGYSTPPFLREVTLPMLPQTVSRGGSVITHCIRSRTQTHAPLHIKMLRRRAEIWVSFIDLRVDFQQLAFAASRSQWRLYRAHEWHVMTLTWIPCLHASFEVHSEGCRLPFLLTLFWLLLFLFPPRLNDLLGHQLWLRDEQQS